jgi:hypothetical protein
MADVETIVINCSKDASDAIRAEIDSMSDTRSQLAGRRNLDGNTAAWIVIATLAVQTLPHILGYIAKFLESKQVKKIKVGDIEIENPTPKDLERLREMIATRVQVEKKDGSL